MNKNKNDKIIINKINLNLADFSQKKSKINLNRVAFIFLIILFVIILYSTRIVYLSSKTLQHNPFKPNVISRADITDRNGNYISKSVFTSNIGIDPKLVKDKKKLLLKLKYTFPDKDFTEIEKKIYGQKFFYIEKKLIPEKYQQVKLLGEKSIRTEQKITRIYPDKNLFSHVVGQIDDNNNGISGLEKSYDEILTDGRSKLTLTLDKEIQFIIRNELLNSQKIFNNIGGAGILMNIKNGEILSLVSVPDFDLNSREDIFDVKYINRATKGVYELGSVFKTFTIAAGLNYNLISPNDMFLNIEKKLRCGDRIISEYDETLPKDLSVEDIMVYSSNIGSVKIGQIIGQDKLKQFLEKIGVLNHLNFDLEETGKPLPFKWRECKLKTVSYGHGITTTPIQLAKGYAILANGGYEIKPTLIKEEFYNLQKNRILNKDVSSQINKILRKVVTHGTASLSDVEGFDVGGKTGTAQIVENGVYTKKKINTFASPKYI